MTCYLRLHEIAVAVRAGPEGTDWDECLRLWRAADGVGGRDLALGAMPVTAIDLDDLPSADLATAAGSPMWSTPGTARRSPVPMAPQSPTWTGPARQAPRWSQPSTHWPTSAIPVPPVPPGSSTSYSDG